MPVISLLGQTYTARSLSVHGETCINWYPEKILKDDPSVISVAQGYQEHDVVLYPTPGTISRCDTSQPSVRGMMEYNGTIYAVAGTTFYSLTQGTDGVTLTAAVLGQLPTYPSLGPVSIITNGVLGQQILICDGTNKYVYNLVTMSFATMSDPVGVTAALACYMDGYGIFPAQNTSQFYLTALTDFSTITQPDSTIASAEVNTKPDSVIATAVLGQYLYVFCKKGTEVWYDAGTTNIAGVTTSMPFARVTQNYLERGCVAPFSIAKGQQSLFWLTENDYGQGRIAKVDTNSNASIISTIPIMDMISGFSKISDAIAYVYSDRGHEFYVITFPTADKTLVYDLDAQVWHTRSTARTAAPGMGVIQGRHIGNCYAFLNGVHYVGDYNSGKIYQMSTAYFTDNGTTITRERTSMHLASDNKRISGTRLEIDMNKGSGLTSGQGSNPMVSLEVSKDGGHTFTNKGLKSFGALGNYLSRVYWTLLGTSRDWVFRIRLTDPVDHVIIKGILDYEVGDS